MEIKEKTIFDSYVLKFFFSITSKIVLKILGWKIEGEAPKTKKYVLIAAPHTSNWDFLYTMLIAFALKLKVYVMAKKELFDGPAGPPLRWLGVIPIDRSKSNNIVAQAVQLFHKYDELVMVIPTSGTRQRVMKWKTGFYHIANGAGVPISLGFLNYGKKTGGFGHLFQPTGDVEADMIEIKSFYTNISGKIPSFASSFVPLKIKLTETAY